MSKINRDISDIQLKASLTNLVSNVRNAYWDFVYTTQAVESAQQSLALATKLVEDNTIKVEVGTMAPIDIVSAQAEQATRQQQLVTAQNSRRTAELTLKRLIVGGTDDPNWLATLDPIDRPEFRPEPVDVQAAVGARARQPHRPGDHQEEPRAERERDEALQEQHAADRRLRAELRPAGRRRHAAHSLEQRRAGQPGHRRPIPGGVGDALSMLLQGTQSALDRVSVNFSYPLGVELAGHGRWRPPTCR